jgi:huntingtin interacting protein 1
LIKKESFIREQNFQSLLTQSRERDTGMKLEVNDKILDSCTDLMKAIKILIIKAKELQKEIVAQGRVSRMKNIISLISKQTKSKL